MGMLDGKVAFVTGAARGMGRSHAVRLAEEGAAIIAVDICAQIETVPYPMSTKQDLDETVRQVTELGRPIVAAVADVRDDAGLKAALNEGIAALGTLDIVVANAGIAPVSITETAETYNAWRDVIDVDLTGVFNTIEVSKDVLIEHGRGGSIVVISSTAGNNGIGGRGRGGIGYTAAKHGVVGLMKTYANMLAPARIRVNSIHPTGVNTPMVVNDAMARFLAQDPSLASSSTNALPVEMLEPRDISEAVLWLASDAARYITGVLLPVDAGFSNKK